MSLLRLLLAVLVIAMLVSTYVEGVMAGHENPFQQSYYPHEVRFFKIDNPDEVPRLIAETSDTPVVKGLHLYLAPVSVDDVKEARRVGPAKSLKTLGSIYTVLLNPVDDGRNPFASKKFRQAFARFLIDREALATGLGDAEPLYIPITRYHPDYRFVIDIDQRIRGQWKPNEAMVKQALADYLESVGGSVEGGRITIEGSEAVLAVAGIEGDAIAGVIVKQLAEKLEKLGFKVKTISMEASPTRLRDLEEYQGVNIVVERLDLLDYIFERLRNVNGIYVGLDAYDDARLAAHIYLKPGGADDEASRAAQKLLSGDYSGWQERMNLIRTLILGGIDESVRTPVMLTYQHYLYNDDYDQGVENMARSPITGPFSDVFYRTVKLRLFPWNGWLLVGLDVERSSAYNPVLGFTDKWGRNLWMMLSDSASVFQPYNGSWEVNRVVWMEVESPDDGVKVPSDALTINGDGRLVEVGEGVKAKTRILYRVLLSHFHHDEYMSVADIIYPYIFLKEWTRKSSENDAAYDAELASLMGEKISNLVAFRVVNITEKPIVIPGSYNGTGLIPWVEVYLNYRHGDKTVLASYMPPWSTVPWELLVLMEEVVKAGGAAFSKSEAEKRGVPWLDLVRGPSIPLLEQELERLSKANYIPPALAGLVKPEEAAKRWSALKSWYEQHGHFLVTNGPYYLSSSNATMDVITVTRMPTYPLGVGSYDYLSIPRYTKITSESSSGVLVVKKGEGLRLNISVEVEEIMRFARNFTKKWRPSYMADVMYFIADEDSRVNYVGLAERGGEKGEFIIRISPDITSQLSAGNYTMNIVTTARYKYFSWPETVNLMLPYLKSVPLKVVGGEEAASSGAGERRAGLEFGAMALLASFLAAILIVLIRRASRARHT